MALNGPYLDPLTGVYSRVALEQRFAEEIDRARRYGLKFSLLVFDLDHFKSINDAFGHRRGDEVLTEFARRVGTLIRASDLLFRYGGDEFVILLPHTAKADACQVAENLLAGIGARPIGGRPAVTVTASFGAATYPEDGHTPAELFDKADQRHYVAKRAGRSRLVSDDPPPVTPMPSFSPPRILERDGGMEAFARFLDSLGYMTHGVFRVVGKPGMGHRRFAEETRKLARLRGFATLSIRGRPALRMRSLGVFWDAVYDWPDLPPASAGPDWVQGALRESVAARGNCGLLITVRGLAELDAESMRLLQAFLFDREIPQVAILYSATPESARREFFGEVPQTYSAQLHPLSQEAVALWLRSAMQMEPEPQFVQWIYRQTGGVPRLVQNGLQALHEHQLLTRSEYGWVLDPGYDRLDLADLLGRESGLRVHNLPLPATSFVGREREMRLAKERLEEGRLLTVLGPGGVGKTRLALQVAAEVAEGFRHGVWVVSLAAVTRPELLGSAIAGALGLEFGRGSDPNEAVLSYLQGRELLLVLDNMEQLIPGASLISAILDRAPQVAVIVTSRARLHLPAETLMEIDGLPAPAPDREAEVGYFSPAVHLFVDRARALDPTFLLNAETAPGVAAICRQLAGLPLGIELAAAWVRVLSVAEIAAGIGQNLDLLTTTWGDLPERQRSLRAAFTHSWNLLSPDERAVFSQLSVFAGGATREAAWVVAGASLSQLAGLMDKSLVRRVGEKRYVMHELLRQFAGEVLTAGEAEALGRRHAEHYLAQVERLREKAGGPDAAVEMDRIADDYDNVRAALHFTLSHEEAEMAWRFVDGLSLFWTRRGHLAEGRGLAEAALALTDGPWTPLKARAAVATAWLAQEQGDYPVVRQEIERALPVLRAAHDGAGTADALSLLALLDFRNGEYLTARAYLEEGLSLHRERGDRAQIATTLVQLSLVMHSQGDVRAAYDQALEALELQQAMGDPFKIAQVQNNLGTIATAMGDYPVARRHLEASLALRRSISDLSGQILPLLGLGAIHALEGDLDGAEQILQEALEACRRCGMPLRTADALERLGHVARRRGDYAAARDRHRASLRARANAGARRSIAANLAGLAATAEALGEWSLAARLFGAVKAHFGDVNLYFDAVDRPEYEAVAGALAAHPDQPAIAADVAAGEGMEVEEAVRLALGDA